MDPFAPSPDAAHAVEADGDAFVWQPGPGLIGGRGSGVFTLPLARYIVSCLTPLMLPGTAWTMFVDFEQVTRYTREAREYMSAFSLAHLELISVIHFLVSSKFVALGLSSIRDEIGEPRFRVYSERAPFLRSFTDVLQAAG